MPSSRAAFDKWLCRLAIGLLLPLTIAGAALVLPPSPRVSLKLPDGQLVLAVSPDCSTLATFDGTLDEFFPQPGTIRLWDLRTGGPGPCLDGANDLDGFAAFSPDGQVLCGISWTEKRQTYRTWSVVDGEQLGQLATDAGGTTSSYQRFSPDSRFLLLERHRQGPSGRAQLEFWDVGLREARATIPGTGQHSHWAADGRKFATYQYADGGRIERVAFYELSAEELALRPIVEHAVSAEAIAFSPDLDAFATVDWPAGREAEAALTLRDMSTGAVLAAGLPCEPSWRMWRLEWDRERRRLTILWVDPDPDPFQARTRLTRREYDLDSGGATRHQWFWRVTGEFSPDYHWFAFDGLPPEKAGVELGDTAGGGDRGPLRHDGDTWWGGFGQLSFTNDSRFLLVSGLRRETVGGVSVDFQTRRGSPIQLTHKGGVIARLWDLEARREVGVYDGCFRAYLSQDDTTLVALGSTDREITVWDVPARKPWRTSLAVGMTTWALLLLAWRLVRRLRPARPA